ncbi:hypothetical protein LXM25_05885 [Dyadobacter sp. LJ53]|uniref:hypothetical protein n=1 Tax=Dyadobacter chenwenxiniae TaxID=2906456 RepID=UPI001F40F2FA|nr:hypothetical protein [Dyadobacter chenwenxiniae]MCF0049574.1 hypothetical protein [Dyadobacter chenwenxiniae]
MKITKLSKIGRIKPCNDNRHDQFVWEFLHTWLDLWFTKNDIPQTSENFNRALHYNYELTNRPWVSEDQISTDVMNWLEAEAKRLGIITVELTRADLLPYMN